MDTTVTVKEEASTPDHQKLLIGGSTFRMCDIGCGVVKCAQQHPKIFRRGSCRLRNQMEEDSQWDVFVQSPSICQVNRGGPQAIAPGKCKGLRPRPSVHPQIFARIGVALHDLRSLPGKVG